MSVTYHFRKPIPGTVRNGDKYASWELRSATFNLRTVDQAAPSDSLVFNLHHVLRDDAGEEIPVEVLSLLDVEGGLREAFQREFGPAWDAVQAD